MCVTFIFKEVMTFGEKKICAYPEHILIYPATLFSFGISSVEFLPTAA